MLKQENENVSPKSFFQDVENEDLNSKKITESSENEKLFREKCDSLSYSPLTTNCTSFNIID